MTGPAAHYVALGRWHGTAFWVWTLSALYFASSVFYVKLRVLSLQPRREEARHEAHRRSLAYHGLLAATLVLLTAAGFLGGWALLAFLPVLARAGWSLLHRPTRVNLRRVGFLEILYSINFLFWSSLAFRTH
jgi:hypothetical protein